jgi:enoyl-CoA hydratase/carnithine racemase
MKKELELPEKFQKIKNYFSDANIKSVLTGGGDLNELGQRISKTISYKAPLAIELANKIIDEGSQVNLNDGLEIELSHLAEIFSTQDALEGLNSVVMRKRPEFKGR